MRLLERIGNTIYPPRCIFCRETLGQESILHICSNCYVRLPFSREILLPVLENGEASGCNGAVSVFRYTGIVKESLIRFKFYNKPGYYRTYARLLADRLRNLTDVDRYDMVMSVPLHKQKEFARGFNQAYLISKALCTELMLPEASWLLKRQKYTDAQSRLDKQSRQDNIKGAFLVTSPESIRGKSILLVDDILTTGSTLNECGSILKQAGARKIMAAVVATGRKI